MPINPKPKTLETPPEEPTRRTVEFLFDSLIIENDYDIRRAVEIDPDVCRAEQKVKDREAQLDREPMIVRLRKEVSEAEDKVRRRLHARLEEATAVRNEYLGKGLTPEVKTKIARLVSKK